MNVSKLSWDGDDVPIIKPRCSCLRLYEDFIEMLNDFNLSQVVREATRGDNILDLFLTTDSILVNSVYIYRGLSDHDIVKSEVSIYQRANWKSFRNFMTSFSSTFLPSVKNKTVGQAWSEFKNTIQYMRA